MENETKKQFNYHKKGKRKRTIKIKKVKITFKGICLIQKRDKNQRNKSRRIVNQVWLTEPNNIEVTRFKMYISPLIFAIFGVNLEEWVKHLSAGSSCEDKEMKNVIRMLD